MKHLILEDSNLTYMVYFRPRDKVKLYETLYNATKEYYECEEDVSLNLLDYTTTKLNEQGFKVCDITEEMKERVYLRSQFQGDAFFYKGVYVMSKFDKTFMFRIKTTYFTCKSIENAIKLIDRKTKNGK